MRKKISNQPLNTALKPIPDSSSANTGKQQIVDDFTIKRAMPANGVISNEQKSGVDSPVDNKSMGDSVRGDGAITETLTASPTDEYVSAGGYVWLARYIKALPFYIDDTTRDFGDDLYERMELDPQVSSCIGVLKSGVLAQGIEISPVQDEEQEVPALGYSPGGQPRKRKIKATSTQAQEIADFCRWNMERLERSIHDVSYELLDALAYGNKVAEQVYEYADYNGKLMLCLKALKVKPRRSVSFVVDVYFNVLGIIGLIPGQGAPVIVESIIGEPGQVPNLLPRKKFIAYTNRGPNGDPRGQSDLRVAYNAWWSKMQTLAEYLKYISQFASPSLWGTTAEKSQTYTDPKTGQKVQPEDALLYVMQQFRNGSVGAFPHGVEINALEMEGQGAPFLEAIDLADRQITKSILYQTLATEEGVHQARAASETHQDILGLRILTIKATLAHCLKRDMLMPLLEYNFGIDAANKLCPNIELGKTEHQDFAQDASAIGTLTTSGFLHISQYPEIDRMLGLPPRDIEAQNAELAAEQQTLDPDLLRTDITQQTDKTVARNQAKKTAGRIGSQVDQ